MNISIDGLRALNEYRRDSLLTYLALRHTLSTSAGCGRRWAEEIAPDLVLRSGDAVYLRQDNFKSVENGRIVYREAYYPGPNEALAESVLLAACNERGSVFRRRPGVFSYHLAAAESTDGFFVRYMELFRKRQAAIARRCRRFPQHVVLFADIRNFYPSVSRRRANVGWRNACDEAELPAKWRKLGEAFLAKQARLGVPGVVVGPRFSHLVADLVLRELDSSLRKRFRGAYYRYVDDFAIVVPRSQVAGAKSYLRQELRAIGLKLHPEKFHLLPAREWPRRRFAEQDEESEAAGSRQWMRFVDSLKGFLVTRPEEHEALRAMFGRTEFRLPLPRYLNQVRENQYVGRFAQRLSQPWFRRRTSRATPGGLVRSCLRLRRTFHTEFKDALFEFVKAEGIQKKWVQTRVKFALGKLIMLGSRKDLSEVAEVLAPYEAFSAQVATVKAIINRDVSDVLRYGASTANQLGELITGTDQVYVCFPKRWSKPVIDAYVALFLRGVRMLPAPPRHVRVRWPLRIVGGQYEPADWTRIDSPFLRALGALSGACSIEHNRDLISAPLDPGEPLATVESMEDLFS